MRKKRRTFLLEVPCEVCVTGSAYSGRRRRLSSRDVDHRPVFLCSIGSDSTVVRLGGG